MSMLFIFACRIFSTFFVRPLPMVPRGLPKGSPNSVEFCELALDKVGLALVPGIAFGKSPYFRLSYATSLDELKKACLQIEESLKKLF